jgi:hypothetical protein
LHKVCIVFVACGGKGAKHPFMRTSLLAVALLLSSSVFVSGCSGDIAQDDTDQVESALTGKLSPAELAATKGALRAICNANRTRMDNLVAVRAQVDPLIDKLARHFGPVPATQKLPLVQGAWRQLWSDYPYPMTPLIKMDPTQIYQVVDADGHYWNIGDQRAIGFLGMTGLLRGAFVANGTRIDLKFTNLGFRLGRLGRNENLVNLADSIETGERFYFPLTGQAPQGPVGIEGTLETVYVDADLRVEIGTQEDFVDGAGKVLVPGYGPKVFVLDRAVRPAK